MKKIITILITLSILSTLCSCSSSSDPSLDELMDAYETGRQRYEYYTSHND